MSPRVLVSLLFVLAVAVHAGERPSAESLAWMSGHWAATIDGVQMEELWTAPQGGLLLGLHRDVRRDGRVSFEFLRIAEEDNGLVFIAQPSGRPPTRFPLVESSATRVVFANPAHDFPKRILYWRDGATLCARVEGAAGDDAAAEQWCWARTSN